MFDYYSKVDDYLNGVLSDSDKLDFENAMSQDHDLKKVVESNPLYSVIADEIITDSISAKIRIAQKSKLKDSNPILRCLFFLVPCLILVLAILFHKNKSDKNYREQLFAEYYFQPYDVVRGSQIDPDINAACEKAHAYIELNDIDKAIMALLENIKLEDESCKEKSFYLLALISIKKGEFSDAKIYLNKVLNNDFTKYDSHAKKLLGKIK